MTTPIPAGDNARLELLDHDEVCELLGDIHPSTLYRGIAAGRYPAPIHVGPGSSRWLRSEIASTLQAIIAARRPGGEHERLEAAE